MWCKCVFNHNANRLSCELKLLSVLLLNSNNCNSDNMQLFSCQDHLLSSLRCPYFHAVRSGRTSAVRVYLVSSSHADYKAAAGCRLSDWAKPLPAFNLLLWYGLLWVITAVPNQLALTCIYKKTKQEGRKIIKSITLIPWLCKILTCSYLHRPARGSIFVSFLVYSFKLDCGNMTF